MANPPSDTTSAYYDLWIEVYQADFISVYPSSVTEGQGHIKWRDAHWNLESVTDTNWVKASKPTSDITGRSDANLDFVS